MPLGASALCKTHLLWNRCPPWTRHNTMETLSTLLAHRSQVDSLHKGSVMPIFQVSLMSVRTNYWQTLGWPTFKDAIMFPWRHCNTLKRTCLKICEQSAIFFYISFDAAISFKNNNFIQFYSKCILLNFLHHRMRHMYRFGVYATHAL